jgi:type I site-specific restriction endonuclease
MEVADQEYCFLADRNILADQAFNSFSAFPDDALIRIKTKGIKKNGGVPTNGSIFYHISDLYVWQMMRAIQHLTLGITLQTILTLSS